MPRSRPASASSTPRTSYGDGRSEQLIGRYLADHPDVMITVATKMGRRVEQRPGELHTGQLPRLDRPVPAQPRAVDQLDLVQLHCPPTYACTPTIQAYDALDTLVDEGVVARYGVSVETCDEALTAMSRRGTATVQIILNAFRMKPLEFVLPTAKAAGVGIIARVPLASGLLSGRYTRDTRVCPRGRPPATTTGMARRSTPVRPSRGSTTKPESAPPPGVCRTRP